MLRACRLETMLSLGHILVATDFSPISIGALRHALGIARRYHSTVSLLHVVDPALFGLAGPDGTSADTNCAVRDCEALEASLRQEGILEGLNFSSAVRVGPVWKTVREATEQESYGLLVLGTHGRTGISKLLLGSVADSAFRYSPCPVLTVGPHALRSKYSGAEAKHFLVPTNLSPESMDALPYGISLAKITGVDITLLHVLNPISEANRGARPEITRVKELLQKYPDAGNIVDIMVEHGEPAEIIVRFADSHQTDIIVMDLHAWRGDGPALWHTAYKVVTEAGCPVLTMKRPAQSE